MFRVKEVSISDPKERDIATRRANPRLASQAPIVRKNRRKKGFLWGLRAWVSVISKIRVRRMLSVVRRTINRWARWERKTRRVRITGMGRIRRIGNDIAGGPKPFFGLQDQC